MQKGGHDEIRRRLRYTDPEEELKAYSKAKAGAAVWMKHGALDYKECVGEDLQTRWGTPFLRLMKLKRAQTVVFMGRFLVAGASRSRQR